MRQMYLAALMLVCLSLASPLAAAPKDHDADSDDSHGPATATPIKHLVVIFDENIAFDHYFATYPNAVPNDDGSIYFGPPKDDTPAVNGLSGTLLTSNPNFIAGGSNPFRLDRSQASTCNTNNGYTKEQQAFDGGLVDKYSLTSPTASCGATFFLPPVPPAPGGEFLSMGYYDGNTVTALWNYAQNYALSDNFFDSEFGVTVEGHMNLLSGQTNGLYTVTGTYAAPVLSALNPTVAGTIINGTIIVNVDPFYDDCGGGAPNVAMAGVNVGNLLNKNGVSWGWFYGDFEAATPWSPLTPATPAKCIAQYNPHYAPFDYYPSTANPHHIDPASLAAIGSDTCANLMCANHNYDLSWFFKALAAGNLPSVTFLKFAENDTGHASDSTPLEEQTSIVNAVNAIEESKFWGDTAIVLLYDDTGGWYDHAAGPIVSYSTDPNNDAISGNPAAGTGSCGSPKLKPAIEDRCGFGVRMPFLVISPYAKSNFVDHSLNDTTSVLRFIEYNWGLGRIGDPNSFDVLASGSILSMFDFDDHGHGEDRELILDPTTGQTVYGTP